MTALVSHAKWKSIVLCSGLLAPMMMVSCQQDQETRQAQPVIVGPADGIQPVQPTPTPTPQPLIKNYLYWCNQTSPSPAIQSTLVALQSKIPGSSCRLRQNKLQSLIVLDLSNLKVASLEPFRGLDQLKSLDLSNNDIESLDGLEDLRSITELKLSGNRLTGLDLIQGLDKINNLQLSRNRIVDITRLQNLVQLRTLYLDGNLIESFAPLKNLPLLETVKLSDNPLTKSESACPTTTTSPSLAGFCQTWLNPPVDQPLVKDFLYWCQSENKSADVSFAVELIKSKLKLTDCVATSDKLQSLLQLDLSKSQLKSLEVLRGLRKVTSLKLSDNMIDDLSALEDSPQLTSLSLDRNNISQVASLSSLKKLKTLKLDGNPIEKTPEACPTNSENLVLNAFCSTWLQ